MNRTEIVDEVLEWFGDADLENQRRFLLTSKKGLIEYHHTLGRNIRNHFRLWENEWTPDIKNGVDCSSDHPDEISMKIIEEVWERLHNDN